jgi:hypothetical protein
LLRVLPAVRGQRAWGEYPSERWFVPIVLEMNDEKVVVLSSASQIPEKM